MPRKPAKQAKPAAQPPTAPQPAARRCPCCGCPLVAALATDPHGHPRRVWRPALSPVPAASHAAGPLPAAAPARTAALSQE